MYIIYKILIVIGLIAFGIILDRLWIHFKRDELKCPINPIPTTMPTINEQEYKILQLYLQEWQVIISTQMHFNDLILRFRSITLTAFVTLVGATVAIEKFVQLSKSDIFLISSLPATLWLTAFIIDFGYYHRLLLGSVAEASKFDNSDNLKAYGLFGMSTCISEYVHPPTSKILVFFYYFVPFIVIAFLLLWRFQ